MEEGRSLGVSRLKVGLIAVLLVCCIVAVLVFLSLNSRPVQDNVVPSRLDSIPVGAVKVVPDVARALDGSELYFHSSRTGGLGGLDVWVTRKIGGEWQTPENVAAVNTVGDEGWPYVTQDAKELWFTRTYLGSPAIYRSAMVNGTWIEPELIISQFAGEPSVDGDGNIYSVHHFYTVDSRMIEADIYIARRK